MAVRTEIRTRQEYPPYCNVLLQQIFAGDAMVVVTKQFTEGQSGIFLSLVESIGQTGQKDLSVVKIGPSPLLEQELHNAQNVAHRFPDFIPISGQLASVTVTTEDGRTASYSGVRYQLAGNGNIETLRNYALTASSAALWTIFEKRIFQQLDRIWRPTSTPIPMQLNATYDRVLPVNLLLEFDEADSSSMLQLDATREPTSYPQCQLGDWVQLHNFVITQIDTSERSLTLNLPQLAGLRPSAYCLQIRGVINISQYKLYDRVDSLAGRVVSTRQLILQEAAHTALPTMLDLTQPFLYLPGTNERLPNPLLRWPALLQEQMLMRFGTVHGDLNISNVLIDIATKTTLIIDWGYAHRDHVLLDLARLESELVLHLVAIRSFEQGVPPTAIHELYNWLDYVTQRAPNSPGSFSLPQPLLQIMPSLQSAFIALVTIRNHVREYLAVRDQWREYYSALALTLLGSLKSASLERVMAGTNPKAVAFWGAATVLAQIEQPARFLHINWQQVRLDDERSESQQQDHAKVSVYIDYQDQRSQTALPVQPRVKILFLSANPLDTIRTRIDEEVHAIDQALCLAEHHISDIHVHQVVTSHDLQELLLRHHPDIVHFSGHGRDANELLLQDANGNAMPLSGPVLQALFGVLKAQIRCVVFNACSTDEQAKSLAKVIDCVVRISQDLPDNASLQFAVAFYRALAYGRSVHDAFNLGQAQIELSGLGEGRSLQLYGKAAAHAYFVEKPPTRVHSQTISLPLLLASFKAWTSDFFRLAEADEHARSSWAGMTLYLFGVAMRRVSSENFLAFVRNKIYQSASMSFDETPIHRYLDVAAPEQAVLNRVFSLAVAVRQSTSPLLSISALPNSSTGKVQINWPRKTPFVRLRIEVVAPECESNESTTKSFKLYHKYDSEIFYFLLTPNVTGRISIIVYLYQEEDVLGSTLSYTEVGEQIVGKVRVQLHSKPVVIKDDASIKNWTTSVSAQPRIKVLFLTANPFDTAPLNTGKEARAIDQALRQAEYRIFEFIPHHAVRIDDLQELLLRYHPDIVHFSGHGTAKNELLLEDADGNAVPVSEEVLHILFDVLHLKIRCVVLNACFTEAQARGLSGIIGCVVGTTKDFTDEASILFSQSFYQALGYGCSVQDAFRLGQTRVAARKLKEEMSLQLYGTAAAHTYFVDE